MRYELSDCEWNVTRPMLPNKARGIPRVDDRRIFNGIFWILRSGALWRDLPESLKCAVARKRSDATFPELNAKQAAQAASDFDVQSYLASEEGAEVNAMKWAEEMLGLQPAAEA